MMRERREARERPMAGEDGARGGGLRGWPPLALCLPRVGTRGSQRAARKALGGASLAFGIGLLLVGCGGESEPAAVTPASGATATVAAGGAATADGSDAGGGPGGGSPAASPGEGASGALTLGDLVARVDAAWAGVGSYRSVFVTDAPAGVVPSSPGTAAAGTASPVGATPAVAGGTEVTVVREVVVPDRRRLEFRRGEQLVSEAVAVGERYWVRGELARRLQPAAPAEAWVEVGPEALDPSSAVGAELAGLRAPATSPLAVVREGLRPQEVRSLGPVEAGGRGCELFGFADTTVLGDRIDYEVALDPDGLPCLIVSRTATAAGRTEYLAFNEPLVIEPPATSLPAATPLPGAPPATPVGRD